MKSKIKNLNGNVLSKISFMSCLIKFVFIMFYSIKFPDVFLLKNIRMGMLNLNIIFTKHLLILQNDRQAGCLMYPQILPIWRRCTFHHMVPESGTLCVTAIARFRETIRSLQLSGYCLHEWILITTSQMAGTFPYWLLELTVHQLIVAWTGFARE